jgi:hypothetical protein
MKRGGIPLGVPLNYFFCENEVTAELARLVANMTTKQQEELIDTLKKNQKGD